MTRKELDYPEALRRWHEEHQPKPAVDPGCLLWVGICAFVWALMMLAWVLS